MKKKLWIAGMTCPNCLKHLKAAFEEIGVSVVASDLESGTIAVESRRALDDAALIEVVEEGGYDFVRAEEVSD